MNHSPDSGSTQTFELHEPLSAMGRTTEATHLSLESEGKRVQRRDGKKNQQKYKSQLHFPPKVAKDAMPLADWETLRCSLGQTHWGNAERCEAERTWCRLRND